MSGGQVLPSLSLFFFSLSLSFSPLFPSFSFSLPFPADYLFYRLFPPYLSPYLYVSVSLFLSPPTVSLYPSILFDITSRSSAVL